MPSTGLTHIVCAAAVLLSAVRAGAQTAPEPAGRSYEETYRDLIGLQPQPGAVAPVSGITIVRDAARFDLEQGTLALLSPVGGRVVAAAFVGRGTFRFEPPTLREREHLYRYVESETLEEEFTTLFLLFTDSTEAELRRAVTFGPASAGGSFAAVIKESLEDLGEKDAKEVEPDVMRALLNGGAPGLFFARVRRRHGDPFLLEVSPYAEEGVSLGRRRKERGVRPYTEPMSQFATANATDGLGHTATIRRYAIETWLPRDTWGNLSFAATAAIDIVADDLGGPWMGFRLYPELVVDSARWDDGTEALVFKGEKNPVLWVRADPAIGPGTSRTLTVSYHGELIERYGDAFFIRSSIAWYPHPLHGRHAATFDLTYHSPTSYILASVGDLVDSSSADNVLTSRWKAESPIRNASFNIGLFERREVTEPGVVPVTLLWSDEIRRREGDVGVDVSSSLKFYQSMYGDAPVSHVFATEIPYGHGEAFPGFVHLSWLTFLSTDKAGADEVFRAHEVAHQWWGIAVDFDSYHDQWLSEGFAQFSGLWYLQTVRGDNKRYFGMLREWREDLGRRHRWPVEKGSAGPISLGYRSQTSSTTDDYGIVVYEKGAWVVHMLRVLLLDLQTMKEDRFTAMMKEFYRTYRGRRASTADFRRVVERYTGIDMGWFFRQWVDGTAFPTYRVAYRVERDADGRYRVHLRVRQDGVPEDFEMYVPVSVDLGNDRWARLRVHVQGPETAIDLPPMPGEPRGIRFGELEAVLGEVKTEKW